MLIVTRGLLWRREALSSQLMRRFREKGKGEGRGGQGEGRGRAGGGQGKIGDGC